MRYDHLPQANEVGLGRHLRGQLRQQHPEVISKTLIGGRRGVGSNNKRRKYGAISAEYYFEPLALDTTLCRRPLNIQDHRGPQSATEVQESLMSPCDSNDVLRWPSLRRLYLPGRTRMIFIKDDLIGCDQSPLLLPL